MKIAIDDALLKGVNLTPQEAVLDFAVGLYTERRVTLGRAAEIASLSQAAFLKELGKRRIPIHYDLADLEADWRVIRETEGK